MKKLLLSVLSVGLIFGLAAPVIQNAVVKENNNLPLTTFNNQPSSKNLTDASLFDVDYSKPAIEGEIWVRNGITDTVYVNSGPITEKEDEVFKGEVVSLKPYASKNTAYRVGPKSDNLFIWKLAYGSSKSAFVNANEKIVGSTILAYNFWNSWKGWTHKNEPDGGVYENSFSLINFNYRLTGKDNISDVWKDSDPSHSNNETVAIRVEEKWDNTYLTLKIAPVAWVSWAWGSAINHGALLKNRMFSFHFEESDTNKHPF